MGLDYCGCQQAPPKTVQLLRSRLFPATVTDPKTAATFRVLESFQMLSFTSKVSAYEFYQALARRTDNTGTSTPPVTIFHCVPRSLLRFLYVGLLSGLSSDSSRMEAYSIAQTVWTWTRPFWMQRNQRRGVCHPVSSMSDAWHQPSCGLERTTGTVRQYIYLFYLNLNPNRWLYALFVGIDTNFRLKRMNVSTDVRDPGLNHGYAYLVERQKFEKYLDEYGKKIPDDKSSCNNHDAIKSASMRGSKATAASGLGTVECSRHDMKRPTAVGDLQKGERSALCCFYD